MECLDCLTSFMVHETVPIRWQDIGAGVEEEDTEVEEVEKVEEIEVEVEEGDNSSS